MHLQVLATHSGFLSQEPFLGPGEFVILSVNREGLPRNPDEDADEEPQTVTLRESSTVSADPAVRRQAGPVAASAASRSSRSW